MANSVLLQAGAYAKFAQSKNASQLGFFYNNIKGILDNIDNNTEENLKTLFDAWNKFIEEEYTDEKEKWQINFDISNTTQSTKVNEDNTIDYSDWIDNSSEEPVTSILNEINNLKKEVITIYDKIKD